MNDWDDDSHDLRSLAGLRALYSEPAETATAKVADHVHPLYRPFIEASPFAVLATLGPHGLDTSPRGDAPGFVTIADDKTLLLPDRRGNNRIDSLSNIVHDPRMALLFLVPGCREALRVNGSARISVAPALLSRLAVDGKPPRSVLVIRVRSVFFQCGRAMLRSGLWDATRQVDRASLPSIGTVLQTLSGDRIDGAAYDAELPTRQRNTLY
ncbi:pyridoxamine 5'-phosphate oxidase family protein [Ideonella sp. BN130291]|uniref:pyridoxamine 5'-phosphate oxidase family protein n=1 Tax=Ideonella sp. BN130291 TaxID=3112940 RepID=UPI002E25B1F6|nr:pyridoxamine 5'-phosphate oxidase family protein [Ideonella sp. BN130291]